MSGEKGAVDEGPEEKCLEERWSQWGGQAERLELGWCHQVSNPIQSQLSIIYQKILINFSSCSGICIKPEVLLMLNSSGCDKFLHFLLGCWYVKIKKWRPLVQEVWVRYDTCCIWLLICLCNKCAVQLLQINSCTEIIAVACAVHIVHCSYAKAKRPAFTCNRVLDYLTSQFLLLRAFLVCNQNQNFGFASNKVSWWVQRSISRRCCLCMYQQFLTQ